MKNNQKPVMTTHDRFMQSLTPEEKIEYEKGYRDFLLSEFVYALRAAHEPSVQALAKEAKISPEIIHVMRLKAKKSYSKSALHKILKKLDARI